MTIVFATPYTPPAPKRDLFTGVSMRWVGWDDTEWSLSGDRAAGVRMQAGVRGLDHPSVQHYTDAPAGIDGARWRGSRTNVRDVFWPLWVWHDGSTDAWLDYDAAFWRTLDPTKTGRWFVTRPNGSERWIDLRHVPDGSNAWDASPGLRQWAPYAINLQAEQPYWCAADVARTFVTNPSDVNFFPSSGTDLVVISSGAPSLGSATVTNPGDVDAWATYWVNGTTTAAVGTADGQVIVPFAVDTDELLVIDTSPAARTAIVVDAPDPALSEDAQVAFVAAQLAAGTGTDRTTDLGTDTEFRALPPGDSALALESTGSDAGFVRVSFTPMYWRAW